MPDGQIVSSIEQSDVLKTVPPVAVDFVFCAPEKRTKVSRWLRDHRERIIPTAGREEGPSS